MLKLRVLTALVLLPVVLGAIFFLDRSYFALVAGAFFLAGGWEWSGMMGPVGRVPRLLWLAGLVALMAAQEVFRPAVTLQWLPLWWLLALGVVIGYPGNARYWYRPLVLSLTGYLLLVPSWAAVVTLQERGAVGIPGGWAILFVLSWVWAADTGAYFAGRAFGKHKLAPTVSPGKTVEGLVGGVLLALVVTALVAWLGPVAPAYRVPLLVVALVTVLASVLGDLFESMVKRERGIKDSGTLLPGHGGMLDRIDSVTAALPVALAALGFAGLPGGMTG